MKIILFFQKIFLKFSCQISEEAFKAYFTTKNAYPSCFAPISSFGLYGKHCKYFVSGETTASSRAKEITKVK